MTPIGQISHARTLNRSLHWDATSEVSAISLQRLVLTKCGLLWTLLRLSISRGGCALVNVRMFMACQDFHRIHLRFV